jgi:uncharacterized protein involved in exopolysaccharide biosynthesis
MRPAWRDPADRGALFMTARHPWIMCGTILLCLGAAYVYLRYAPIEYTSTALIRLRQGGPVPLGASEPLRSGEDMASYLNAELAVLTSAPVLQSALDANPRLSRELSSSASDPIAAFKRRLHAAVGRKDGIVTITFDARDPHLAAETVNAVIAAYTAQAARTEEELDRNLRTILAKVRAEYNTASAEATAQMVELRKQGFAPGDSHEPEQDTSAARTAARAALVDAAVAKAHADEAVAALGKNSDRIAELDKLVASGAVGASSEVEDAETRLAIQEQEVKLRDYVVAQRLLPSHPQVVAVQQRIDRLRLNYAAAARVRWEQARDRAQQAASALRDQEEAARVRQDRAAQYARADAQLQRIDHYATALDDRMQELRAREASGALNVVVVDPARPPSSPSRPDPPRILALATGAGALLGALLAYAREAKRCRRPLAPARAMPLEEMTDEDILPPAARTKLDRSNSTQAALSRNGVL